jgi:hypothetical protein
MFIIIIFSGEQKAHIPGAKNIPYAMLFNEDETFKSIEDLKEGKYIPSFTSFTFKFDI